MSDSKQGEIISLYQSEDRVMNDAIDRIVIKLYSYKEKPGKSSILLTGCGPGNGTTSVAINLAVALAGAGWKTLLTDADMRKGIKYKRLNANTAGLSDYLEDTADINSIICPTNQPNLHYVMCGPPKENTVRLLCSDRMQRFVKSAQNAYEFVVFDCPSITIVPDAAVLLPAVDCAALVLSLGVTAKKQLAQAKAEVSKYADKYAGIIVNRVDMRQYARAFPRYDYFEEDELRKTHRRFLRKAK